MRLEHIVEKDLQVALEANRNTKKVVLRLLLSNLKKIDNPTVEESYEIIRGMISHRKKIISKFSGKGVSKFILRQALEIMYLDYYLPESEL